MVFLYHLSEPDTGAIRYIGKTVNPRNRKNAHLRDVESGDLALDKNVWLRSLHERGLKPIFTIISEASLDSWKDKEQRLIREYRNAGHKLTNMSPGGEPGFVAANGTHPNLGKHLSESTKSKISAKAKQRWKTDLYDFHKLSMDERFGKEKAASMRRKLSHYNATKIVSAETKLKVSACQSRPIVIVDAITNEIRGEFPNARLAGEALGCKRSNVNNRRRFHGLLFDKYRVYFKDEYESQVPNTR